MTQKLGYIEKTMLVSSDTKFIRLDQKHVGLAQAEPVRRVLIEPDPSQYDSKVWIDRENHVSVLYQVYQARSEARRTGSSRASPTCF